MRREGEQIPDEFLSQVAHEMRGSLNTILGWAEYLRGNAGEEPARVRAAETIIRHARQQTWMVTELVDTCRLASGTLLLSEAPLVIDDLIRAAMQAVQPIAQAKSVTFNQIGPAEARVRGDARRLTQALTTVLLNAVHFSASGGTINIVAASSAGVATIEIQDHGLALSSEAAGHLFEREPPRSRAEKSPRRDFRMGLSLTRDVIVRHGGHISAESRSDMGVVFRIALPEYHGASGPYVPAAPTRPARRGAELTGVRVLLVDDEADARDALVGILTHYGAVVRAAGSAADAVATLTREPIDVLLADIGMPGEDGYDLIHSVRGLASDASGVPAVAVTAFTSDIDRRRALEAGFQVHLSKPIDPSALVATVAELGRSRTSVR